MARQLHGRSQKDQARYDIHGETTCQTLQQSGKRMAGRQSDGLQHLLQHAVHSRSSLSNKTGIVLFAAHSGSEEGKNHHKSME